MSKRARKLKVWNGRWERDQHAYVCAYSISDAIELVNELVGYRKMTRGEVSTYWSAGCWGTSMAGVEKERGVWVQTGNAKPVRLLRNNQESVK